MTDLPFEEFRKRRPIASDHAVDRLLTSSSLAFDQPARLGPAPTSDPPSA